MGMNHVRVYGEIDGVRLTAVADISPEQRRLASENRDLRAYEDYRRMLAEERIDLLSVCVPTRLHLEVALAAIERGVPLLVEKPIAAGLEEGREMARAAQRRRRPPDDRARRALQPGGAGAEAPACRAGKLGRVFQVYARRTGPFPKRVRDVGVVHDLAPHDIDVMRFLLESEVERVYAETEQRISTEHEDMLSGLLRFRNGVVGVLEVNWLTPVKVRQLSVLGEKGLFYRRLPGRRSCSSIPRRRRPVPPIRHPRSKRRSRCGWSWRPSSRRCGGESRRR